MHQDGRRGAHHVRHGVCNVFREEHPAHVLHGDSSSGLSDPRLNLVEVGGMASREGLNAGGYGAGVGPLLWAAWVAAMAIALVRCIGRERAGSRAAVVLD